MPSSTAHRRGGAATGRAAIPVPKRGPDFSDSYPGVDLWPEREHVFKGGMVLGSSMVVLHAAIRTARPLFVVDLLTLFTSKAHKSFSRSGIV